MSRFLNFTIVISLYLLISQSLEIKFCDSDSQTSRYSTTPSTPESITKDISISKWSNEPALFKIDTSSFHSDEGILISIAVDRSIKPEPAFELILYSLTNQHGASCFEPNNWNKFDKKRRRYHKISYQTEITKGDRNYGDIMFEILIKENTYGPFQYTIEIQEKNNLRGSQSLREQEYESKMAFLIGFTIVVLFLLFLFCGTLLSECCRNRSRANIRIRTILHDGQVMPIPPIGISAYQNGNTNLSLADLDAYFPAQKYSAFQLDFEQPCCPICLDPFQDNTICRQLLCSHIFHSECIAPWLEIHTTCPLCMTVVDSTTINTLMKSKGTLGSIKSIVIKNTHHRENDPRH